MDPALCPAVRRRRRPPRGAALLVAMVLLTLVATLAAGMVWQQWRAVQVEIAERGRAQLAWILNGATDWARLILREDLRADAQKGQQTDHLNEPWAQPLAEARLSTFLSADQTGGADAESGPDAFLAGEIVDAQARYNLRNLVAGGQIVAGELEAMKRLCSLVGLEDDLAQRIASGLLAAEGSAADAPLLPMQLDDLAWLQVDQASIERLRPVAWLLPAPPGAPGAAQVNLNTASREVIAAVLGIDPGSAERLVQFRQRQPLMTLEDAKNVLPATLTLGTNVAVNSSYFEVRGRMRLDDRVLEERSLVRRDGPNVVVMQRWREHRVLSPPGR
jgi:general secretion pathway protein K